METMSVPYEIIDCHIHPNYFRNNYGAVKDDETFFDDLRKTKIFFTFKKIFKNSNSNHVECSIHIFNPK